MPNRRPEPTVGQHGDVLVGRESSGRATFRWAFDTKIELKHKKQFSLIGFVINLTVPFINIWNQLSEPVTLHKMPEVRAAFEKCSA